MKKKIEINELENVNGGTNTELAELVSVIADDNSWAKGAAYVPVSNFAVDRVVKSKLRDVGVSAVIHTGLAGTGLFAAPNEYKSIATGEPMTHLQALSLLQAKG